ncbi:CHAD domain-containing protein [Nocardioides dilutus]
MVQGCPARASAPDPATRRGPARLVLHPYLVAQVGEIEHLDPQVRRDGPGGVHGIRKACRRLRAVLAAYGPLLDRRQAEPLRAELRWFAGELGEARDHEVVRTRLDRLLDEQPDELVVGPVHARLQAWGEAGTTLTRRAALEVLGSARYHQLRTALDGLVDEPAWTGHAETRADQVLPRRIRKEWVRTQRVRRETEDPHELRKAAKRLRHALEVVEPVWPTRAAGPREAAQALTEVLGARQDTVTARSALVVLSRAASSAGEDTFTYGRLHAEEERNEASLLAQARSAWRDLEAAMDLADW